MSEERSVRRGGQGELDLVGRIAVVTGGSSGIGAAIATVLAHAGATVVVGYNAGRERADDVVASLQGTGHLALRLQVDDSDVLRHAADEVNERFGRCDVLVNSGGWTQRIPHADLDTLTDDLFDDMMRVHVRGPFAVVRTFTELLRASDDAVVVNVSSVAGSTALGSNIAYCAAKAALDNMTMSLARVLSPSVRVIGVAPAAVETGFVGGRVVDVMLAQAGGTPLQILVHPTDVATSVLGCITHMRIATGTTFSIDGGRHL